MASRVQVDAPDEMTVPRLDNSKFRVTELSGKERRAITALKRGGRVNPDPTIDAS